MTGTHYLPKNKNVKQSNESKFNLSDDFVAVLLGKSLYDGLRCVADSNKKKSHRN